MDERFSFSRFFDVLAGQWRLFAVVGLMAALLSYVFSGPTFIKPRYRSDAIVYPVNLNSYSIETRADQLLQLLESNSIRDSVIQRFDLVAHYKADTAQRGGRFILYNIYKERVEVSKTRYESVEIEVTDEDPVIARATDLLAVSFSANDYVGHAVGPDDPQVRDMALEVDPRRRTAGHDDRDQ